MATTIISKYCTKCKTLKTISDFYEQSSRKDGLQSGCKECRALHQKKYRRTEKGKQAHRQGNKKYSKTEKGKQVDKRSRRKYVKTEKGKITKRNSFKRYYESEQGRQAYKQYHILNPDKIRARRVVNRAIRVGELPRLDTLKCNYCPVQAQEYHHHKGYAPEHWLDVVPVCCICHKKIHHTVDAFSPP